MTKKLLPILMAVAAGMSVTACSSDSDIATPSTVAAPLDGTTLPENERPVSLPEIDPNAEAKFFDDISYQELSELDYSFLVGTNLSAAEQWGEDQGYVVRSTPANGAMTDDLRADRLNLIYDSEMIVIEAGRY